MDEKKTTGTEMGEEEVNKVSGGRISSKQRKCLECPTLLPDGWPTSLCKMCMDKKAGKIEKPTVDLPFFGVNGTIRPFDQ